MCIYKIHDDDKVLIQLNVTKNEEIFNSYTNLDINQ